ncbi:MAG: aspartyl protease family protein [Planctomycetia bacterium]|nr:aspartyl protease family protein [Planctomycetia bacterium]
MFALLIALTLTTPQSPGTDAPAVVPFEIIGSKHMAVKIKINGKGPYRVIFDTGAPISLISNKVAQESGLIKQKAGSKTFMGMNGMIKIPDLQVGEVKAKDIQVIVMDHPTVNAIGEVVGPVEGIIGYPFFAKFRTTVNYQNKTLTMQPSGFDPGDVMASLMTTMMAGNRERKIPLSPTTIWGLSVGKETSDEENGVEVVHVLENGAGQEAGIKVGDRILVVDGMWTDTVTDCQRAFSQIKTGQKVALKIRRDGKDVDVKVTARTGF